MYYLAGPFQPIFRNLVPFFLRLFDRHYLFRSVGFRSKSNLSQGLSNNRTNRRRGVGIFEDALSCLPIQTAEFVSRLYDRPGRGPVDAECLRLSVQRSVSRRHQRLRNRLNWNCPALGRPRLYLV